MGYEFVQTCRTVKSMADEVLRAFGDHIVDCSRRGQELYAAVRHQEHSEVVSVVVCLIRKDRDGSYGFKIMDETQYPYYFNCPEKILKLSNNPEGRKWRLQCRANREVYKIQERIAEAAMFGQEVETVHGRVKYLGPYRNSKTQFRAQLLESDNPEKVYRVPLKSIKVDEDVINETVTKLAHW